MKYTMMLRSGVKQDMPLEETHARLRDCVSKLPLPWCDVQIPDVVKKGEFINFVKLDNCVYPKTRFRIGYQNREQRFRDEGRFDDHLVFDFDTRRIFGRLLVEEVFPALVGGLSAYYGLIAPELELLKDSHRRRKRDYRRGIVRLYEVNFIEGSLIEKQFRLSLSKALTRLKPYAKCWKEKNGLFVVFQSPSATSAEINETAAEAFASLEK